MKELRLDYFLMRGGLLAVGDVYVDKSGCECVIGDKPEARLVSKPSISDKYRFIKSFAPRKNTGKQPVPDDFPVGVIISNGDIDSGVSVEAESWAWDIYCGITSWKPDIDKLIEQQAQYDFEQGKALSPQVEAGIEQIAQQLRGAGKFNGECTKDNEGYNVKVYTQNMIDSNKLPNAGMLYIDGNGHSCRFIGNDCNYVVGEYSNDKPNINKLSITSISSIKPIKSQEEVEREEAEENLIQEVSQVLAESMLNKSPFRDAAIELKERGLLKKITLPIK